MVRLIRVLIKPDDANDVANISRSFPLKTSNIVVLYMMKYPYDNKAHLDAAKIIRSITGYIYNHY